MLNKLLKYDLKNIFKIMVPIYIVAIFISTLARGAYYLSDNLVSNIICFYVCYIYSCYFFSTFCNMDNRVYPFL